MLRLILVLVPVFLLSFAIFSCGKEYSNEGGGRTEAMFTLDCSARVIGGAYVQGTAIGAANTVMLKANVTKPGSYRFVTTANGITFTASGNFANMGAAQIITFFGSGNPAVASISVFVIDAGCSFSIPINAAVPQAIFLLDCTTASVNGNYTLNIDLDPLVNTVTLTANVTKSGAYNIIQTLNGITFTATGTFPTAGSAIPVTFKGTGLPTVVGQNNFTFGLGNCVFTVNVIAINPNADFLLATIGGISKLFNTNLTGKLRSVTGGPNHLTADGFRYTTGREKITINFFNTGGSIVTGSYENIFPSFPNPAAVATYIDITGAPRESTSGRFNITSITALNATGNFFGVLTKLNSGGAPERLPFTTGSFRISF